MSLYTNKWIRIAGLGIASLIIAGCAAVFTGWTAMGSRATGAAGPHWTTSTSTGAASASTSGL